MQFLDEPFRVGPGAFGWEVEVTQVMRATVSVDLVMSVSEGDECALVAPRLDYDDTYRDVLLFVARNLIEHLSLGVPFITAGPESMDPVWQQTWTPNALEEPR